MRTHLFVLFAFLAALVLAVAARAQSAGTPSAPAAAPVTPPAAYAPPALVKGVGIDQNLNAQLPMDLVFHDDTGVTVHLSDLQHQRPVILEFVQYNCPSLCTVILNDTLSTVKVLPQLVGDQFDVWTVSFDPTETATLAAAKKAGYLRSYQRTRSGAGNAASGWHFLTGDQANITALTHAAGFRYKYDPATKQFVHPAGLMVLTPEGKIARYFFGVDYEPTDLRLSLVEASHGKIGTLTDTILLFCYHYDPTTGKYNLAVANTLRIAATMTILIFVGAFALLFRADRRRTRRLMAVGADSGAGDAAARHEIRPGAVPPFPPAGGAA